MRTVREVLESKNVAVIGASRDPLKPGSMLLNLLQTTGFTGRFAGVNPQGGEIHGIPLYRSLEEIPFPVELAVMLIPPRLIPNAMGVCARNGVKGVVIPAEGFAEAGPEGAVLQEEIGHLLRSSGMRGFGPNTMGIMNTETGLTTAYFANAGMLQPGRVGIAAQSGIFVGAMLRYLNSRGLTISKALGLGNKVDVNESDALEYLAEDEQTRVVGMYLEDVKDGRRFLDAARRAASRKPVLLLKGGRTAEGAMATASHTASMAVEDAVLDGALRQAGVLRVQEIGDLVASLMAFEDLPLPKGPRIAFVTYSGAQAIMCIDTAVDLGMEVARFSESTRERLSGVIATASKAKNPVDLYPDMNVHGFEKTSTEIVGALMEDDGVDAVVFISFAMFGSELYRPVVEIIEENRAKPVFFSLLGEKEHVEECRDLMQHHRIPFALFPETAVRVLGHMWRYARTQGGA
jgi:acyl-CoA synthetase (NDP forming)